MPTYSERHQHQINIESEGDIVAVRKAVREAAGSLGFGVTDVTRIVTAASELARNIQRFAGKGVMSLAVEQGDGRKGLVLTFVDHGPGIADIKKALELGYTTGGGLGLGLPGAKRLMDEMEIQSELGRGTTVRVVKWLNVGR